MQSYMNMGVESKMRLSLKLLLRNQVPQRKGRVVKHHETTTIATMNVSKIQKTFREDNDIAFRQTMLGLTITSSLKNSLIANSYRLNFSLSAGLHLLDAFFHAFFHA